MLSSFIAWALNPTWNQVLFIHMESETLIPRESAPCNAQAAVGYNNPNCPSITSYFLSFMVGGDIDSYFGGLMVWEWTAQLPTWACSHITNILKTQDFPVPWEASNIFRVKGATQGLTNMSLLGIFTTLKVSDHVGQMLLWDSPFVLVLIKNRCEGNTLLKVISGPAVIWRPEMTLKAD